MDYFIANVTADDEKCNHGQPDEAAVVKRGHVVSPERERSCLNAAGNAGFMTLDSVFLRQSENDLFVVLDLERMTVPNPPFCQGSIRRLVVAADRATLCLRMETF